MILIQGMKHTLFAILIIFFSFQATAQDCQIEVQGEVPACPGALLLLSVEESDTLDYLWTPGNDTTATIPVRPEETTEYKVLVYNNNYECEDSVTIEVYPKITVEFNQTDTTCTGADADCQAKVEAIAGEEFPFDEYNYTWEVSEWNIDPERPWYAIGLCGDVYYSIRVEDPYGCYIDTSYQIIPFRSPEIEITALPDTLVYIKNPWITFSYENLSIDSMEVINHWWDFGDSTTSTLSSPRHLFDNIRIFYVGLNITDNHGCDTIYYQPIEVKPVELMIPNAFTPNGDGINDILAFTAKTPEGADPSITLDTYYKSNELLIFNRYGHKVFEANDYQNDWGGGDLPDGVYFFVLTCHGQFGDDVFKGSITIIGKNNY